MAVVATLTATPVPSGNTFGGVAMQLFHVTVTCSTSGSGTYRCTHGLPYTPTVCIVVPQQAELAVAPAATVAIVSYCPADTDATYIAFSIPATTTQTYHVIYG